VKAIDYIPKNPFPVRATVDVAGFWKLRGFSFFSGAYDIIMH
jgi:hypothetical protein